MSMSLTHLRSVSGGLHLSRFGQLANSPSPSNPHLLTYATPSSWIQQYHLVHTVRPHSIASYQYVAPHPAFQPAAAAAAAVSHPSLVEHQQEGQPSRTFFSPSPKRVRLEGEPMDEADLHPASAQSARSRRRSNFLVTLFSSRYERGRNIFGRLFGTLTCMVALAPGGDDTGAVHAAAASAAAESAEGQPSFTHPNAAPHSSAKPASGPSPPPYSFPFDNLKRFIPDLGKLEPVRPAVEFGLAAMVGYLSGCGVRTLTRVGLFIGGVGGLALYCLHREGIISFNVDKMRQLGAECYERSQNEVKKRIESNPELWQSGAQLIETLTTTSLGIGFTAGFVMAFGQ